MTSLNTFLGLPIEVPGIGTVYPPKVIDVASVENFNEIQNLFTITQESIWDDMAIQKGKIPEGIRYENAPTPFQLFLQYFFFNKKVVTKGIDMFLKKELIHVPEDNMFFLGIPDNINNMNYIDEDNYINFQNAIRQACGLETVEPPDPNEHPRISRFKAKARYREMIAAKQSTGGGLTITDMAVAVCCIHNGITPLNIGEISYPSLRILFQKLQKKERHDMEVRAATSGFGGKDVKITNWMIDEEE